MYGAVAGTVPSALHVPAGPLGLTLWRVFGSRGFVQALAQLLRWAVVSSLRGRWVPAVFWKLVCHPLPIDCDHFPPLFGFHLPALLNLMRVT